jgi:hypothetical protein
MPRDDQRERAFDWRPLPYVEGRDDILCSGVYLGIHPQTHHAATILNNLDGEDNFILGRDASSSCRISWTPDNVDTASGGRGAPCLRTGLLRTPFAHVCAELLTTYAELPVKVIAYQKAHAI